MFDDSINLVVWGHEHDCRIQPEPVAGKEYLITQPGSSVATSLADGEAIPKLVPHVLVSSSLSTNAESCLQTRWALGNTTQYLSAYSDPSSHCPPVRA